MTNFDAEMNVARSVEWAECLSEILNVYCTTTWIVLQTLTACKLMRHITKGGESVWKDKWNVDVSQAIVDIAMDTSSKTLYILVETGRVMAFDVSHGKYLK